MLNIDWSKAPEWAKYIAMDADFTFWWFEKKPSYHGDEWFSDGQLEKAFSVNALWERPE